MARGRPQKPHECSWLGRDGKREVVPGLYKCPDGRWRINATGQKFTEHDERLAVARFRALTAGQGRATVPLVELEPDNMAKAAPEAAAVISQYSAARPIVGKPPTAGRYVIIDCASAADALALGQRLAVERDSKVHLTQNGSIVTGFGVDIPEAALWAWCREQFLDDPKHAAESMGMPGLQNYRDSMPKASLKLAEIIDNYRQHSPATDKAKNEALAPLNRLVGKSGAKTLDDLTTDVLLAFKVEIEKTISGPATRRAYYARVKSIISFGLKTGLDAVQIRATLDRAKVLWTPEALPPVQPRPISREHFHALLKAGNSTWRAWLLVGLNLCLHIEEVCDLRWADLNLERGTYACIRNKTRRQRIPRAATMWPETIAALRALPRRGTSPFVFVSTHGTRYNKNTRVNDFKELREKAGLPDEVTFDCLRDGAYTSACQDAPDERWARVLAGHRAPGLQDNYVLRNPERTRPACDAVYRAYGPFPMQEA